MYFAKELQVETMKKVLFAILNSFLILTLTGCSGINSYIEEQMIKRAGLVEDEEYLEYQSYKANDQLDNQGFYQYGENDDTSEKKIHVSFASNSRLRTDYYYDAEKMVPVDVYNCYLNPGQTLYVSVENGRDASSSMYGFSHFVLYQYEDDGVRKELQKVFGEKNANAIEVQIPEDFSGKELSIEPIGEYNERVVSLYDYYIEDDDTEHAIDGTWTLNEKQYNGDEARLNPIVDYVVSYNYDPSQYFFVTSEPSARYNSDEDGLVVFEPREALDKTEEYRVGLHPRFSLDIYNTEKRIVKINGDAPRSVETGDSLPLEGLRYGDTVVIETDKPWVSLEENEDLLLQTETKETDENQSQWYRYTLLVPEKDGQFVFDPSEYSYEHGTIIFKCFGKVVLNTRILAKGSKIEYSAGSADDGYWLPGRNRFIVVGEEDDTRRQLESIHFEPRVTTTVILPQPDYGGEIHYHVGEKRIYGREYEAYSGDKIKMSFKPWAGWYCNLVDGTDYIVGNNKTDTVEFGDELSVQSVFTEDSDHKPALNMTLEKSAESIEFNVTNGATLNKTSLSHSGLGSKSVIKDEKIDTWAPIKIEMKNRALPSGKAIRLMIEKIGTKRERHVEVRYGEETRDFQTPIYVYGEEEQKSSTVWYKSINITVSVVNIEKFVETPSPQYGSLYVRQTDATTKETLHKNDLIEGNQKVTVSIQPNAGYYITGKGVTDGKYQSTMTYSKYVSDIKKVLNEHEIKKYCEIELDTSDAFASYSYMLDKDTVSGKIKAKEGQKLVLKYEILDDSHRLSEPTGGVLGFGASDKTIEAEIVVSDDMDGKTIGRTDFGIEVSEE